MYYQGDPRWWLPYTVCLCGLAVIAALLHDRTARRTPLLTAAAVLAVLGLAFTTLSMVNGPDETRLSPPTLHPEQLR